MRIKGATTVALFLIALCFIISAQAKDKFSRGSKKSSSESANPSATTGAPPVSPSPSPSPSAKSAGDTKPGDQKVDITDLENRYWTAKDTEFNVVQNRLYTKSKKFSLTPLFGASFNDPYESNVHVGLSIDYYFSEREGVGITGWKTTATDAKLIGSTGSLGAVPDRNIQQSYFGAYYTWVPIYAKLSLLEKKILYFDMGISPGLGVTNLTSATYSTSSAIQPPAATNQSLITASVDIYQQLYLAEHWALKLTLINHFYNEQLYGARSGSSLNSQFTYSGSVLFGVTFFQ